MKLAQSLALGLSLMASLMAQATEIVIYENKPVTIKLHKNEERMIQFGDHVEVGITKGQQMKRLFRVQSAQGAVHFLPYEAFERQRVQIKRVTDGRVILLDLIASEKPKGAGELEDMKIILASENVVEETTEQSSSSTVYDGPVVTPVDLTRFVAQKLYGPSRLQNDVAGITETAVDVEGSIRLFKGANKLATTARAVVAYAGGGYNIAGILVRNVSAEPIQLDYLDLNLPFSHATLQHHALAPAGTPGDSTVLYLVTERSLKETLQPWTYYHDIEAERKARELAAAQKARQANTLLEDSL